MIFFSYKALLDLSRCGISIPLLPQRKLKTKELIAASFPDLIHEFDDYRDVTDLIKSIHHFDYLSEQAILNAFELMEPDGSFSKRYNPTKDSQSLASLVDSIFYNIEGTILACEAAFKNKEFSYFIGGGLHHAMSFAGRGFCLLNDIVVAAKYMQQNTVLKQVWVIDVDAHKGDGTAELTQDDSSITTFSIHMQNGWPLDNQNKEDPCFIPSDIDIPVLESDDYLNKLKHGLERLNNYPTADLAIIVSGSDPYEHDALESAKLLALTEQEMLERDKIVYEFLKEKNIPQAYVMAGGYGDKNYIIHHQFVNYYLTNYR